MKFVNFDIENRVYLAPMAGITDLAFRTVCRHYGADLCYSEMISAKGLYYKDKKTKALLLTNSYDVPLIVQIFGNDPYIISEGVKIVADMGFKMIDINSGCPAPKIVNNNEGSALMKNPKLLGEITEAAVRASSLPVSVKIRTGYTKDSINAVECAKIIEESGASAITVHGKTREQFYSGEADYTVIKSVKDTVKIPVIANGEIHTPEECERVLSLTGCDFAMVGRAALGNPFIFEQMKDYFKTGTFKKSYSIEERLDTLLKQASHTVEYKGEHRAVLEARKHIAWYLKGIKNSKNYRMRANTVESMDEIQNLCESVKKEFSE
ncbi:MAG: tRNA dihydrouridine synthase DusB [Ruminococcaceae bacterium]|nr:tRNA dihydrouridine synthase DusB [Oscillospiraceae bacterium]